MNLRFSKTLIGDDSSPFDRPSRKLRLYTILDETDQPVIELHFDTNEQFLKFSGREISINPVGKLSRKPKYLLVDKANNKSLGEIIINGQGINNSWQDVPSKPNAILIFEGSEYYFRRISPDVSYNWFKKETWGYFKFILYALKGDAETQYSLKMEIPVFSKPNYTRYRPFTGIIESNFENHLVIALSFFLFEHEFEADDAKYDG